MERQKQVFAKHIVRKKVLHTNSKAREQRVIACLNYAIGLPMGLLFCFINWIKES